MYAHCSDTSRPAALRVRGAVGAGVRRCWGAAAVCGALVSRAAVHVVIARAASVTIGALRLAAQQIAVLGQAAGAVKFHRLPANTLARVLKQT